MAIPEATATVTSDPWQSADEAKPREFEYYGQIKFDPWYAFFPGGKAQPVPFDPAQHEMSKRATIIESLLIPIDEMSNSKQIEQSFTDFSTDWTKIVLPSIKALPGVTGIRDIHDKYVRVAMVPGKRKRIAQDGTDTGEYWNTWKFVEVFADKAACVAAYAGNGGAAAPATEPQPVQTSFDTANSPEYQTALKFARTIVLGICKGKAAADLESVQATIATSLSTKPMIAKYFTVGSPEIVEIVMTELK